MREIFVFGSNLAGRHGKGAAKYALEHYGAIYGVGWGRQGDSFAIPTKDEHLYTLSLDAIWVAIKCVFITYINYHYDDSMKLHYNITAIGCGLAGYTPEQISPMFYWCLEEKYKQYCTLPKEFLAVLNE